MNSFRSYSADDSHQREICSNTSITLKEPAKPVSKPNLKKFRSDKCILSRTEKYLDDDKENNPRKPVTGKSLRFASTNRIHQYIIKRESKIPVPNKEQINCYKCCALI